MELITKSFAAKCIAFPDRVDKLLAENPTARRVKEMIDQASAMDHYAKRLRSGIAIERPIALGVLKLKAGLGALLPAKPPNDRGQGRGGKKSNGAHPVDLDSHTISAYRRIAASQDRLEEYYGEIEGVPTQGEFIRWCAGAHVSNNSGDNEWYTPQEYIDAARKVMGSIDLDPASTKAANKVVGATKFYTEGDDGLSKEWSGNVWLNPPYAKDLIGKFAQKLVDSDVKSACVLVNNATEMVWFQLMVHMSSAICFPRGRVKFWHPNRESAPLQGQVVLYIGSKPAVFCEEFDAFGFCSPLQVKSAKETAAGKAVAS